MKYFAHKRTLEDGTLERQTLVDHSRRAAEYAEACTEKIALGKTGYLAALCHDLGKFKNEFQSYLEEGDECKRGSVNHTFAGCRFMFEQFHSEKTERIEDLTAEILAYAIGAHHGQFDCVNIDGESGFDYRQAKRGIFYTESCQNFLGDCAGKKEISELFDQANVEISTKFGTLVNMAKENRDSHGEEIGFYVGLLARLILSSVVEGDRRDTAEFMDGVNLEPIDAVKSDVWKKCLDYMETKLADFPQKTELQRARMDISNQCRKMSPNKGGIYRLNVPTGGGKTLSALRYALAHAEKWNKDRIIFVTPLLAILEQNAKIIRDYIGDDNLILEHHSNVIKENNSKYNELDLNELAMENWQKPVIITTMVQLLNTMFKGKMSNVRRFHSLANAVIVIDEVQTVPMHMLSLFNLTINFLSEVCGTTFLLCSATQPCFERALHPMLPHINDVVPYQAKIWNAFERTKIIDMGAKKMDRIPELLETLLENNDSMLIICNKKMEAAFLYEAMKKTQGNIFHLSASMCTEHRRRTLDEIYRSLESGNQKTICVSTQVIEAGVDISFSCVVRLLAGMDNIVQAAGRCNRNGESKELAPVYVVNCSDENLGRLKEIRRGKEASLALLQAYAKDPEKFQENLESDDAINWYYRKLYDTMISEEGNEQDYIIQKERNTLFSLLATNRKHTAQIEGRYFLNQAFKTAGSIFQVFDENGVDVVVPFGEGVDLIRELEDEKWLTISYLKDWSQRAKNYTVSLYDNQLQQLRYYLREVNGILVLSEEAYDDHLGIHEKDELIFLEV